MTLKPPKKIDLNKNWMKARCDNPKKLQPKYHLIVTEGTETEPVYFPASKDVINKQYQGKLQLEIHGGRNSI